MVSATAAAAIAAASVAADAAVAIAACTIDNDNINAAVGGAAITSVVGDWKKLYCLQRVCFYMRCHLITYAQDPWFVCSSPASLLQA